jgi:hypothetical protein
MSRPRVDVARTPRPHNRVNHHRLIVRGSRLTGRGRCAEKGRPHFRGPGAPVVAEPVFSIRILLGLPVLFKITVAT